MSTQQNQKENKKENKNKIYEGKGPDGKLLKNRALNRAKFVKNDEYYTLMKDVIQHVEVFKKEWYKDKIIYCPFSSDESNFVKYFKEHGKELGIKELMYTSDDYKNHEDLWMKADLVIDNPPFSIFTSEILPWMIKLWNKQLGKNNLTSAQLSAHWLNATRLTSAQLTCARINYDWNKINPKVQLTTTQLQAPQIIGGSHKIKTAVNLSDKRITTSQLTNNFYKTIDLRDIPVRCSGICCKDFLNPDGEIISVPCTSLCFACPDEMFAPRSIKPLPDWTYQQLLDNKKIGFSTMSKICSHTSRDIISDYPPKELYKDFLGKTLPCFKNINYFPKDFHGYALCHISSTETYNEKKEDTGLFTVYGWKRCAIVESYNEEGKREFYRVLIYHE